MIYLSKELYNNISNNSNNKNNNNKGENDMTTFTLEELKATVTEAIKEAQQGNMDTKEHWAKNSKFYGKVFEDGHIFNPYIDRRWLPAQYLRLLSNYKGSRYKAIKNSYNLNYQIDWLKKEVEKLAYLQKVDQAAFEERSQFLTPGDVIQIVAEIFKVSDKLFNYATRNHLSSLKIKSKTFFLGNIYYKCNEKTGKVTEYFETSDELKFIKESQKNLINKLTMAGWSNATPYKKMSELLNSYNFIKFNLTQKPTATFIDKFMAQGAYYTLRNLVMFEGAVFKGKTGKTAIDKLMSLPNDTGYKGYKINAALVECLNMSLYRV